MPAQSDPYLNPSARIAKAIADISRTPLRVAEVFDDLSHWERIWRTAPDAWNCAEIAGHLFDAEIAFGYRVRTALAEPGKALDMFDQNGWVTAQGYSDTPVEETLATFTALRRNLVSLVTRLSDAELERDYIHALRGRQTVSDTIFVLQTHDARHLVQLGRVSELARQARPLG